MSTQEPTLSDLENQEPQDELDQEQAETFVALSLETVRILLTLAVFDSKQSSTRPAVERSMLVDAISETTIAYAAATGQPVPPPLPKKDREVSPGAIYPDALPGEL